MANGGKEFPPGIVDGRELPGQNVRDASHQRTQLQLLIIQTNGELGEGRQRETARQKQKHVLLVIPLESSHRTQ